MWEQWYLNPEHNDLTCACLVMQATVALLTPRHSALLHLLKLTTDHILLFKELILTQTEAFMDCFMDFSYDF